MQAVSWDDTAGACADREGLQMCELRLARWARSGPACPEVKEALIRGPTRHKPEISVPEITRSAPASKHAFEYLEDALWLVPRDVT